MKSATTTEMTRHMITAMTIPTYRATSSVLGATGGVGRGFGKRDKTHKGKKLSFRFISIALIVFSIGRSCDGAIIRRPMSWFKIELGISKYLLDN